MKKPEKGTREYAIARFESWFEQHGHWMWGVDGRENAMEAYKHHGVNGLPDWEWGNEPPEIFCGC